MDYQNRCARGKLGMAFGRGGWWAGLPPRKKGEMSFLKNIL
jgi:hypothetical protein